MTNTFIATYIVTAYCSCSWCCGTNSQHKLTASGIFPAQGITIAAPRSIPFGTRLHIEGVGWRVVEDRLAKKYDNRIDIYYKSHNEAKKFGKRKLIVKTLGTPPAIQRYTTKKHE